MSIAEIIQAVQCLSRSEKFHFAHILLEDLAREDLPPTFEDGQDYPIDTPASRGSSTTAASSSNYALLPASSFLLEYIS